MKIDIYRHTHRRFIAVPHAHAIPETWAGAKFFKTIELKPGDVRIGMGDAAKTLSAIVKEGYTEV